MHKRMTKRSNNGMARLATAAVLVAGLMLSAASLLLPGSVAAQEEPAARCAIVGFGEVNCPTNVGNAGVPNDAEGCWVRDPTSQDPAKRVFHKADESGNCEGPEFTQALKRPAAITCDRRPDEELTPGEKADLPPPEVREAACDPAIDCTENCNLVVKYINPIIKALNAIIGVAVTLAIIVGGIQYATSADDPQKVAGAKRKIFVALLTLVGYFLFYQFLNWLVPGGISQAAP